MRSCERCSRLASSHGLSRRCDLRRCAIAHTLCRYSSVPKHRALQRLPEPRNPTKQFPRDRRALRRPPTSSHRSGSPGKEMDIHYVAHFFPPVRKPPEREGHPLRRLLTPRPPPPFDFGQSDRVREPDPEIAPKFAVPAPLLRS